MSKSLVGCCFLFEHESQVMKSINTKANLLVHLKEEKKYLVVFYIQNFFLVGVRYLLSKSLTS